MNKIEKLIRKGMRKDKLFDYNVLIKLNNMGVYLSFNANGISYKFTP